MIKNRIFLLVVVLFSVSYAQASQSIEVSFLNVGYGDSILIAQLDSNSAILIDAGSQEYSAVIKKALDQRNIESISHLIITHPHKNHFAGAIDLIDQLDIGNIYTNTDERHEKGYEQLLEMINKHQINVIEIEQGYQFSELPEALDINVLHPPEIKGSVNASSLVLLMRVYDQCVLFTSDISMKEQDGLIDQYADQLTCGVVQVPHHGDKMSQAFINHFNNPYWIASTGENQWGLPSDQLDSLPGKVLRTDKMGNISFIINEDGVFINE